jgi:hypothetical protein
MNLSDMQAYRLRAEFHLNVTNECIDLVTSDGVNNVDNDIGDATTAAFELITKDLLPLTTYDQQVHVPKSEEA